MDGVLAVQESHAGADVSDDSPGLLLGEGFLGLLQQREEIPVWQQLHDEHHPVR